MVFVLLGALTLQSVAWIAYLDRLTSRQSGQVADLCQRLQAPDTAVAQHVIGDTEYPVAHLPFDDDDAWKAHQLAIGVNPLD